MKLQGIDFGNVHGASGVQGFFGEGYWFHWVYKMLGMDLSTMTFVSKTATAHPEEGNMPLTKHYTPRRPFPDCIRVRVGRGAALNAVGLSNPGLRALLEVGEWQRHTKPFFISLTSLANTREGRCREFQCMVEQLRSVRDFSAPFGVQLNLSCPTERIKSWEMVQESEEILTIMGELNVPVMVKYSVASASIDAVVRLEDHPACDAICVSNTIPFGWWRIDWKKVWGSETSPLEQYGGGGLSGAPLARIVPRWIGRLREAGFTKPINGGGGILHPNDVDRYHRYGASSIFLGSVVILRPWQIRAIIDRANTLSWDR